MIFNPIINFKLEENLGLFFVDLCKNSCKIYLNVTKLLPKTQILTKKFFEGSLLNVYKLQG